MMRKTISIVLSASYLLTNVAWAHGAESNFWTERRKHAGAVKESKSSSPLLLAQLPATPRAHHTNLLSLPDPLIERRISQGLVRRLPAPFIRRHKELLKALPYDRGAVRQVLLPAGAETDRLVVFLQDVHLNPEAQGNISAFVRGLADAGQMDLLALEGAFGPIDLMGLRGFGDNAASQEVSSLLLRQGKISGAVQGAWLSRKALPVRGIDAEAIYKANVQSYVASRPAQAVARQRRMAWSAELEQAKKKIFPPALLQLDNRLAAYENGQESLAGHVKSLVDHGQNIPPSIRLFLQAVALESKLNFTQVEKERAQVVDRLAHKLPQGRLDQLVQSTLAYRAGALSHRDFYEELRGLCAESGVRLETYPVFDRYVNYVVLAERLDAHALFNDLRILERETVGRLAATTAQKDLAEKLHTARLMEKLLDFALTPDEWESLKSAALPAWPELAAFLDFYRHAEARNQAMADRVLKAMDEERAKKVTLVAGGFHADGLGEALKRQGVTVLSVAPRLTKVSAENKTEYLSVFAREKTPLAKLFEGQKLFLSPHPAAPWVVGVEAPAGHVARAAEQAPATASPQETFARAGGQAGWRVSLNKITGGIGVILQRAGHGRTMISYETDGKGGLKDSREGPAVGLRVLGTKWTARLDVLLASIEENSHALTLGVVNAWRGRQGLGRIAWSRVFDAASGEYKVSVPWLRENRGTWTALLLSASGPLVWTLPLLAAAVYATARLTLGEWSAPVIADSLAAGAAVVSAYGAGKHLRHLKNPYFDMWAVGYALQSLFNLPWNLGPPQGEALHFPARPKALGSPEDFPKGVQQAWPALRQTVIDHFEYRSLEFGTYEEFLEALNESLLKADGSAAGVNLEDLRNALFASMSYDVLTYHITRAYWRLFRQLNPLYPDISARPLSSPEIEDSELPLVRPLRGARRREKINGHEVEIVLPSYPQLWRAVASDIEQGHSAITPAFLRVDQLNSKTGLKGGRYPKADARVRAALGRGPWTADHVATALTSILSDADFPRYAEVDTRKLSSEAIQLLNTARAGVLPANQLPKLNRAILVALYPGSIITPLHGTAVRNIEGWTDEPGAGILCTYRNPLIVGETRWGFYFDPPTDADQRIAEIAWEEARKIAAALGPISPASPLTAVHDPGYYVDLWNTIRQFTTKDKKNFPDIHRHTILERLARLGLTQDAYEALIAYFRILPDQKNEVLVQTLRDSLGPRFAHKDMGLIVNDIFDVAHFVNKAADLRIRILERQFNYYQLLNLHRLLSLTPADTDAAHRIMTQWRSAAKGRPLTDGEAYAMEDAKNILGNPAARRAYDRNRPHEHGWPPPVPTILITVLVNGQAFNTELEAQDVDAALGLAHDALSARLSATQMADLTSAMPARGKIARGFHVRINDVPRQRAPQLRNGDHIVVFRPAQPTSSGRGGSRRPSNPQGDAQIQPPAKGDALMASVEEMGHELVLSVVNLWRGSRGKAPIPSVKVLDAASGEYKVSVPWLRENRGTWTALLLSASGPLVWTLPLLAAAVYATARLTLGEWSAPVIADSLAAGAAVVSAYGAGKHLRHLKNPYFDMWAVGYALQSLFNLPWNLGPPQGGALHFPAGPKTMGSAGDFPEGIQRAWPVLRQAVIDHFEFRSSEFGTYEEFLEALDKSLRAVDGGVAGVNMADLRGALFASLSYDVLTYHITRVYWRLFRKLNPAYGKLGGRPVFVNGIRDPNLPPGWPVRGIPARASLVEKPTDVALPSYADFWREVARDMPHPFVRAAYVRVNQLNSRTGIRSGKYPEADARVSAELGAAPWTAEHAAAAINKILNDPDFSKLAEEDQSGWPEEALLELEQARTSGRLPLLNRALFIGLYPGSIVTPIHGTAVRNVEGWVEKPGIGILRTYQMPLLLEDKRWGFYFQPLSDEDYEIAEMAWVNAQDTAQEEGPLAPDSGAAIFGHDKALYESIKKVTTNKQRFPNVHRHTILERLARLGLTNSAYEVLIAYFRLERGIGRPVRMEDLAQVLGPRFAHEDLEAIVADIRHAAEKLNRNDDISIQKPRPSAQVSSPVPAAWQARLWWLSWREDVIHHGGMLFFIEFLRRSVHTAAQAGRRLGGLPARPFQPIEHSFVLPRQGKAYLHVPSLNPWGWEMFLLRLAGPAGWALDLGIAAWLFQLAQGLPSGLAPLACLSVGAMALPAVVMLVLNVFKALTDRDNDVRWLVLIPAKAVGRGLRLIFGWPVFLPLPTTGSYRLPSPLSEERSSFRPVSGLPKIIQQHWMDFHGLVVDHFETQSVATRFESYDQFIEALDLRLHRHWQRVTRPGQLPLPDASSEEEIPKRVMDLRQALLSALAYDELTFSYTRAYWKQFRALNPKFTLPGGKQPLSEVPLPDLPLRIGQMRSLPGRDDLILPHMERDLIPSVTRELAAAPFRPAHRAPNGVLKKADLDTVHLLNLIRTGQRAIDRELREALGPEPTQEKIYEVFNLFLNDLRLASRHAANPSGLPRALSEAYQGIRSGQQSFSDTRVRALNRHILAAAYPQTIALPRVSYNSIRVRLQTDASDIARGINQTYERALLTSERSGMLKAWTIEDMVIAPGLWAALEQDTTTGRVHDIGSLLKIVPVAMASSQVEPENILRAVEKMGLRDIDIQVLGAYFKIKKDGLAVDYEALRESLAGRVSERDLAWAVNRLTDLFAELRARTFKSDLVPFVVRRPEASLDFFDLLGLSAFRSGATLSSQAVSQAAAETLRRLAREKQRELTPMEKSWVARAATTLRDPAARAAYIERAGKLARQNQIPAKVRMEVISMPLARRLGLSIERGQGVPGVDVTAADVAAALQALPTARFSLMGKTGLPQGVEVSLNGRVLSWNDLYNTPLVDGDNLQIQLAMKGGAPLPGEAGAAPSVGPTVLANAQKLVEAGRRDAAISLVSKILDSYKFWTQGHVFKAKVLLGIGDLAGAGASARNALALEAGSTEVQALAESLRQAHAAWEDEERVAALVQVLKDFALSSSWESLAPNSPTRESALAVLWSKLANDLFFPVQMLGAPQAGHPYPAVFEDIVDLLSSHLASGDAEPVAPDIVNQAAASWKPQQADDGADKQPETPSIYVKANTQAKTLMELFRGGHNVASNIRGYLLDELIPSLEEISPGRRVWRVQGHEIIFQHEEAGRGQAYFSFETKYILFIHREARKRLPFVRVFLRDGVLEAIPDLVPLTDKAPEEGGVPGTGSADADDELSLSEHDFLNPDDLDADEGSAAQEGSKESVLSGGVPENILLRPLTGDQLMPYFGLKWPSGGLGRFVTRLTAIVLSAPAEAGTSIRRIHHKGHEILFYPDQHRSGPDTFSFDVNYLAVLLDMLQEQLKPLPLFLAPDILEQAPHLIQLPDVPLPTPPAVDADKSSTARPKGRSRRAAPPSDSPSEQVKTAVEQILNLWSLSTEDLETSLEAFVQTIDKATLVAAYQWILPRGTADQRVVALRQLYLLKWPELREDIVREIQRGRLEALLYAIRALVALGEADPAVLGDLLGLILTPQIDPLYVQDPNELEASIVDIQERAVKSSVFWPGPVPQSLLDALQTVAETDTYPADTRAYARESLNTLTRRTHALTGTEDRGGEEGGSLAVLAPSGDQGPGGATDMASETVEGETSGEEDPMADGLPWRITDQEFKNILVGDGLVREFLIGVLEYLMDMDPRWAEGKMTLTDDQGRRVTLEVSGPLGWRIDATDQSSMQRLLETLIAALLNEAVYKGLKEKPDVRLIDGWQSTLGHPVDTPAEPEGEPNVTPPPAPAPSPEPAPPFVPRPRVSSEKPAEAPPAPGWVPPYTPTENPVETVAGWDDVDRLIKQHAGQSLVLVVKLDDTLFSPKGFVGSTAWARERMDLFESDRGRREWRAQEEHMISSGFYKTLEEDVAGRLLAWQEQGIKVVGLTERSPEEKDRTAEILASLGLPGFQVVYAEDRKASAVQNIARQHGADVCLVIDNDRAALDHLTSLPLPPAVLVHYARPNPLAEGTAASYLNDAEAALSHAKGPLGILARLMGRPTRHELQAIEYFINALDAAGRQGDQTLQIQVAQGVAERIKEIGPKNAHAEPLLTAYLSQALEILLNAQGRWQTNQGASPNWPSEILSVADAYFEFFTVNPDTFQEAYRRGLVQFKRANQRRMDNGQDFSMVISHDNLYVYIEPSLAYILEEEPDVVILPDLGARPFRSVLDAFVKEKKLKTRVLSLPLSVKTSGDTALEVRRWLALGRWQAMRDAGIDPPRGASGKHMTLAHRTVEEKQIANQFKDWFLVNGEFVEPLEHAKIFVFEDNMASGETMDVAAAAFAREGDGNTLVVGTPFVYADARRFKVPVVTTLQIPGTRRWGRRGIAAIETTWQDDHVHQGYQARKPYTGPTLIPSDGTGVKASRLDQQARTAFRAQLTLFGGPDQIPMNGQDVDFSHIRPMSLVDGLQEKRRNFEALYGIHNAPPTLHPRFLDELSLGVLPSLRMGEDNPARLVKRRAPPTLMRDYMKGLDDRGPVDHFYYPDFISFDITERIGSEGRDRQQGIVSFLVLADGRGRKALVLHEIQPSFSLMAQPEAFMEALLEALKPLVEGPHSPFDYLLMPEDIQMVSGRQPILALLNSRNDVAFAPELTFEGDLAEIQYLKARHRGQGIGKVTAPREFDSLLLRLREMGKAGLLSAERLEALNEAENDGVLTWDLLEQLRRSFKGTRGQTFRVLARRAVKKDSEEGRRIAAQLAEIESLQAYAVGARENEILDSAVRTIQLVGEPFKGHRFNMDRWRDRQGLLNGSRETPAWVQEFRRRRGLQNVPWEQWPSDAKLGFQGLHVFYDLQNPPVKGGYAQFPRQFWENHEGRVRAEAILWALYHDVLQLRDVRELNRERFSQARLSGMFERVFEGNLMRVAEVLLPEQADQYELRNGRLEPKPLTSKDVLDCLFLNKKLVQGRHMDLMVDGDKILSLQHGDRAIKISDLPVRMNHVTVVTVEDANEGPIFLVLQRSVFENLRRLAPRDFSLKAAEQALMAFRRAPSGGHETVNLGLLDLLKFHRGDGAFSSHGRYAPASLTWADEEGPGSIYLNRGDQEPAHFPVPARVMAQWRQAHGEFAADQRSLPVMLRLEWDSDYGIVVRLYQHDTETFVPEKLSSWGTFQFIPEEGHPVLVDLGRRNVQEIMQGRRRPFQIERPAFQASVRQGENGEGLVSVPWTWRDALDKMPFADATAVVHIPAYLMDSLKRAGIDLLGGKRLTLVADTHPVYGVLEEVGVEHEGQMLSIGQLLPGENTIVPADEAAWVDYAHGIGGERLVLPGPMETTGTLDEGGSILLRGRQSREFVVSHLEPLAGRRARFERETRPGLEGIVRVYDAEAFKNDPRVKPVLYLRREVERGLVPLTEADRLLLEGGMGAVASIVPMDRLGPLLRQSGAAVLALLEGETRVPIAQRDAVEHSLAESLGSSHGLQRQDNVQPENHLLQRRLVNPSFDESLIAAMARTLEALSVRELARKIRRGEGPADAAAMEKLFAPRIHFLFQERYREIYLEIHRRAETRHPAGWTLDQLQEVYNELVRERMEPHLEALRNEATLSPQLEARALKQVKEKLDSLFVIARQDSLSPGKFLLLHEADTLRRIQSEHYVLNASGRRTGTRLPALVAVMNSGVERALVVSPLETHQDWLNQVINSLGSDKSGAKKIHVTVVGNAQIPAVLPKNVVKVDSVRGGRRQFARELTDELQQGASQPDVVHIVILSYELYGDQSASMENVDWQFLVLDESHLVKNPEAKRTQALMPLVFKMRANPDNYIVMMTGSPVYNLLQDLLIPMLFLGDWRALYEALTGKKAPAVLDAPVLRELESAFRSSMGRKEKREEGHRLVRDWLDRFLVQHLEPEIFPDPPPVRTETIHVDLRTGGMRWDGPDAKNIYLPGDFQMQRLLYAALLWTLAYPEQVIQLMGRQGASPMKLDEIRQFMEKISSMDATGGTKAANHPSVTYLDFRPAPQGFQIYQDLSLALSAPQIFLRSQTDSIKFHALREMLKTVPSNEKVVILVESPETAEALTQFLGGDTQAVCVRGGLTTKRVNENARFRSNNGVRYAVISALSLSAQESWQSVPGVHPVTTLVVLDEPETPSHLQMMIEQVLGWPGSLENRGRGVSIKSGAADHLRVVHINHPGPTSPDKARRELLGMKLLLEELALGRVSVPAAEEALTGSESADTLKAAAQGELSQGIWGAPDDWRYMVWAVQRNAVAEAYARNQRFLPEFWMRVLIADWLLSQGLLDGIADQGAWDYLSVFSGPGGSREAWAEIWRMRDRGALQAPRVISLDPGAGMVARVPDGIAQNPVRPSSLEDGSVRIVENMSPQLFADHRAMGKWLNEVRRVLADGGLLVLGLTGPKFTEKFCESLESAGFEILTEKPGEKLSFSNSLIGHVMQEYGVSMLQSIYWPLQGLRGKSPAMFIIARKKPGADAVNPTTLKFPILDRDLNGPRQVINRAFADYSDAPPLDQVRLGLPAEHRNGHIEVLSKLGDTVHLRYETMDYVQIMPGDKVWLNGVWLTVSGVDGAGVWQEVSFKEGGFWHPYEVERGPVQVLRDGESLQLKSRAAPPATWTLTRRAARLWLRWKNGGEPAPAEIENFAVRKLARFESPLVLSPLLLAVSAIPLGLPAAAALALIPLSHAVFTFLHPREDASSPRSPPAASLTSSRRSAVAWGLVFHMPFYILTAVASVFSWQIPFPVYLLALIYAVYAHDRYNALGYVALPFVSGRIQNQWRGLSGAVNPSEAWLAHLMRETRDNAPAQDVRGQISQLLQGALGQETSNLGVAQADGKDALRTLLNRVKTEGHPRTLRKAARQAFGRGLSPQEVEYRLRRLQQLLEEAPRDLGARPFVLDVLGSAEAVPQPQAYLDGLASMGQGRGLKIAATADANLAVKLRTLAAAKRLPVKVLQIPEALLAQGILSLEDLESHLLQKMPDLAQESFTSSTLRPSEGLTVLPGQKLVTDTFRDLVIRALSGLFKDMEAKPEDWALIDEVTAMFARSA